jgi:hypothetical protein
LKEDEMINFIEYIDEKIRIKLPKQLRQKRPLRFFRGNLVRGRPETQASFGIDINLDARRIEVMKEEFLRTEVKNRPLGNKVERLGLCKFGKDGLELLTSIVQPHTGHKFYRWDMIFKLQGSYVMMTITGGSSRKDFENMANEIVTSLVLI